MSKNQMRYERKYLLDRDTAHLLKQRISYVLTPDSYNEGGQYKVSSVYFDDQYNSALTDKLSGVLRREKLRIRYYNDKLDIIHLECKHKHGQMIWKEHEPLTAGQYEMILGGEYGFMKDFFSGPGGDKTLFERFYSTHLTRHLRPVVTVDYNRQAYTHKAGDVRITFDSGLTARKPTAQGSYSVLPDKDVIMEVKYTHVHCRFVFGIPIHAAAFRVQVRHGKAGIARQGRLLNVRLHIKQSGKGISQWLMN